MDEQRGMYLAGLVMSCETVIHSDLAVHDWWLMLQALQLSSAHPKMPPVMKALMVDMGRSLQTVIVEALPEIEELAEVGWQRDDGDPPGGRLQ